MMSKTPSVRTSAAPSEVIERTYQATLLELWELWTTKDGFESWWGPEGFRVDIHTIEARQGGKLYYDMIADTPQMVEAMRAMGRPASHETRGWFSVYEPHTRLTLTHVIDFLPGVKPYESTIDVVFQPVDGGVRMEVTLSGMHDDNFTQMQRLGFTSQLSKLDRRFAAA